MAKKQEIRKLVNAYKKGDGDKQTEILENLEDQYHVDLTSFYGEDYSSVNTKKAKELDKKLKKSKYVSISDLYKEKHK